MVFKSKTAPEMSIWRRTPPAIFPPVLGLFGLGLGWRRGVYSIGLPSGWAEMLLGAVTLLFIVSFVAYVVKFLWRPPVILEDLRVLPGRAGLATMMLCLYLLAVTVQPYSGGGRLILFGGLFCHGILVILLIWVFVNGPAEQRRVTPVWHLSFVGFIVAALAAARLEMGLLSLALFIVTVLMAAGIWAVSAERLLTEKTPPPLRPLLSIHLSPAALFGLVAKDLGFETVAWGYAILAAVLLAAMVLRARWLTEAGFSPLWGAFTFPLAATASLWLALDGFWRLPGMVALAAATIIVPWIAFRVIKLWASGRLGRITNSATA